MLFSSLTFLYYFLPLTAGLYFLAPGRMKNMVLLLASLLFYGWGEPRYVLLMGLSIVSGYGFGLLVDRYRGKWPGRIFCILSVMVSLSFLLYFKYANFFLESIQAITGQVLPILRISLPIGISFYTFQMISYTIDVYRGERAQRNLIDLAAYIAMFPQLVAGPIVTYSQIAGQLRNRTHTWDQAAQGIRRFVVGLSKKVLLANQLGELCAAFRASEEKSVLFYWLYAIGFMLQIYFDFSGYSDMAVGLGNVFGLRFPENFNYPYISSSMTEFWRRWHMTLGGWFREYIYIPLGGNRRHPYRNLFLVWMLTGLWHGASWNFVLWGFLLFLLLLLEKKGLAKAFDRYPVAGHLYMLAVIPLSWLVFAVTDLRQLVVYLSRLFPFFAQPGGNGNVFQGDFAKYAEAYFLPLTAAIFCCTGIPRKLYEKGKYTFWVTAGLLILFWACVYCMYMGLDDPFLYYQF